MVESYTVQLERVQTTIAAIENGAQEYSIGGRTFKKADLPILYKRETFLKNAIARESRGGGLSTRRGYIA